MKNIRTKAISVLTFVTCVCTIAIDVLDGGGFAFKDHTAALLGAAGALGLYYLRDAVKRLQDAVGSK